MSKKQRTMENPMSGEMAPPVDRQYYTVGFICQMIQNTPEFVHRLMQTCNVEFAWTQNGVGVIRGDDLQKMASTLADARDHIEAAVAAAPNN